MAKSDLEIVKLTGRPLCFERRFERRAGSSSSPTTVRGEADAARAHQTGVATVQGVERHLVVVMDQTLTIRNRRSSGMHILLRSMRDWQSRRVCTLARGAALTARWYQS